MSKEKENKEEMSKEEICMQIDAFTKILNVRTTFVKHTEVTKRGITTPTPSGSFEYSPLNEQEELFCKTALMSLAAKLNKNEELVRFKKEEESKEVPTTEKTNE